MKSLVVSGLRRCLLPTVTLASFAILLIFASKGLRGEVRKWTSKAGTTVEAELVEVTKSGVAVLKKKDGKTLNVKLPLLSDADQAYISAQKELKPAGGAEKLKIPEEVEAEAMLCRAAKDAVLVYKFYLAKPDLPASSRTAAEARLEFWKKEAAEDKVRVGTRWMKKAEAEEIHKKVDAKIEHGLELLRLQNGDLARKTLEEAAKLDPDNIKADFLIGIVYGLIADDPKKAAVHFEKCLKREPHNVSVMNNLAVSLVNQKKYAEAARHWRAAATAAPKMKALAQNIGSLLTMAGTKTFKLTPKLQEELSAIYEELVTTHGNPRPSQVVFVYTPPYGADWDAEKGGPPKAGGAGEALVVGSGTGFVVHPHVILTNAHVVERASDLLVVDPKKSKGEPLAAELIAISPDFDLALVRCPGLDAPAVKLNSSLPPRGSDIMILGYPLGLSLGTEPKMTRGAMVAMPDAAVDNMCLFDAVTNPGNSGGPLCDKRGHVVAVVRAVTGGVGGTYGAAIPIANAVPFLKKHIPEWKPSAAQEKELDWPALDAAITPSTVLVLKKEVLRSDTGVGGAP